MSPSWLVRAVVGDVRRAGQCQGNSCRMSRGCSSTRWGAPPSFPHQSHDLCGHCAAARHRPCRDGRARRSGIPELLRPLSRSSGRELRHSSDLRYSAALGSKDTWAAVVLGGVLKANGWLRSQRCSTRPKRTPSEPTSSRRRTSGLHLNSIPTLRIAGKGWRS